MNKRTWADSLGVKSNSELIFFAQYERDIDKFKPSCSSFVEGIYRLEYDEQPNDEKLKHIETWDLFDVCEILNFMKKHPYKAYYCDKYYISRRVMAHHVPGLKAFFEFCSDKISYDINSLKSEIALKHIKMAAIHLCKNLGFSYACVRDFGENVYPRLEVDIRRKEGDCDIIEYHKEQKMIDAFEDRYWNKIHVLQFDYDIRLYLNDAEIQKDKEMLKSYKDKFINNNNPDIIYRNWEGRND